MTNISNGRVQTHYCEHAQFGYLGAQLAAVKVRRVLSRVSSSFFLVFCFSCLSPPSLRWGDEGWGCYPRCHNSSLLLGLRFGVRGRDLSIVCKPYFIINLRLGQPAILTPCNEILE